MKKMKRILLFLVCFIAINICSAQKGTGALQVTPNGHYLQYDNGTPFFWLGDTAWELFHRLTLEEINEYFNNRHAKGFNVIQAVILAELDGLRVPNKYGETPFINMNPEKPNEKYFALVDSVVRLAAQKNIIMALLPTWGDKITLDFGGSGPLVFTTENAYKYGEYLGKRYADFSNIVWVLGGDRPPKDNCGNYIDVYRSMAKGIKEGSRKQTLMTFHPGGSIWESSPMVHNEDWLDFNMIQSGHAEIDQPVWKNILRDWHLLPTKPTIDAEPAYEDHPVNPWPTWDSSKGYFRDYEVRKQLYRSVFSGAMGVTYGHHSIWQFYNDKVEKVNHPDRYWFEALDRPAAFQAAYLKMLIETRPFIDRIPDQSIITEGQGVENSEYAASFRDKEGRYLMVYLPVGKKITINTFFINSKKINAWWFNPKNSDLNFIGINNNIGSASFAPPTLGKGNDWVLIIDNGTF